MHYARRNQLCRQVVPCLGFIFTLGLVVFCDRLASLECAPWLLLATSGVLEVCERSETQWMLFTAALVTLVAFGYLKAHLAPDETIAWLAGLVLVVVLAYTLHYGRSSSSTHALALLAAVVIGQGAGLQGLWVGGRRRYTSGGELACESNLWLRVPALLVLLVVAAEMRTEAEGTFGYRGEARWAGPWSNPNAYGSLMGVGLVLAVGLGLNGVCMFGVTGLNPNPRARIGGVPRFSPMISRWLLVGVCAATAGAMGVSLVKSYSRGAWWGQRWGWHISLQMMRVES